MAQILKEKVRDKILKAATNEFYKKGYSKATLREIAKNAEITTGNIYRYFESKENLYKTVTEDTLKRLNKVLKEVTNNEIQVLKNPSNDFVDKMSNENMNILVEEIINKIFHEFYKEKNKLVIILRNDDKNLNNNIQIKFKNWFKELFEITYGKIIISDILASNLLEGIISILTNKNIENNTEDVKKVETLIKFYFGKEGFKYE